MEPTPTNVIPSYPKTYVNEETHRRLRHLVSPHVDSFNYFLKYGMDHALSQLSPMAIELADPNAPESGSVTIMMRFTSMHLSDPRCPITSVAPDAARGSLGKLTSKGSLQETGALFTPREARESGLTYCGQLSAGIEVVIGDTNPFSSSASASSSVRRVSTETHNRTMHFTQRLGDLPIMVMSQKCHLAGLSPRQLVQKKEEANECGGYFIMNGIEKVVRLLQVPRRNYAMAIQRSSYRNRGQAYSDKGVAMRCARIDQSTSTITLHYLANGGATVRFVLRKQEFLLPVVMVAKALMNVSDKEIFERVLQGDRGNTFVTARLELLLRDFKSYQLFTKAQCLSYLGALFRAYLPVTSADSDEAAGEVLIQQNLFVHVEDFGEKLECLLHMMRKLLSFAQGKCVADNADALMNHELLLPGHLITMYLKDKLQDMMLAIKQAVTREYRNTITASAASSASSLSLSISGAGSGSSGGSAAFFADFSQTKYWQKQFTRFGGTLANKIGTFLSTGNIISSTGLDLMQVSGYTIVAERLNVCRYMSHFQSVHRGQFFTTMKTTAVRKLLPESWGFLCPVHTPDGSPCGLLNHLARECSVVAFPTPSGVAPTTPYIGIENFADKSERDALGSGFASSAASVVSAGTAGSGGNSSKGSSSKASSRASRSSTGGGSGGGGRRTGKHSGAPSSGRNSKQHMLRLLCALGATPSGVGGGDGQAVLSAFQELTVSSTSISEGAGKESGNIVAGSSSLSKAEAQQGGQGQGEGQFVSILLDGCVIGGVSAAHAGHLVRQLRFLKSAPASVYKPAPKSFGPGKVKGEGAVEEEGGLLLSATGLFPGADTGAVSLDPSMMLDPTIEIGYIPASLVEVVRGEAVAVAERAKERAGRGERGVRERKESDGEADLAADSGSGAGAYPGIYLFTQPGRMIRPVLQRHTQKIEWIGPFEQVFMDIACLPEDVRGEEGELISPVVGQQQQKQLKEQQQQHQKQLKQRLVEGGRLLSYGETTHLELNPSVMLSQVAAMTPYSDYNQSPRNMYQCQMSKQTMGTPAHALRQRGSDNKLYRILTPQAPIVQTDCHQEYRMDEYPQGTNAVVAVIAYTGYDMEDAMIINKASYERGFAHGCVYKTLHIDLDDEERRLVSKGVKPFLKFSNVKKPLPPPHQLMLNSTGPQAAPSYHPRAQGQGYGLEESKGSGQLGAGSETPGVDKTVYCSEEELFHAGYLHVETLDLDGLPQAGTALNYGDPIACLVNVHHKIKGPGAAPRASSGQGGKFEEEGFTIVKHKDHESCVVDAVRVLGHKTVNSRGRVSFMRRVSITMRYKRNPIIGDKFSSRHGQKGTLSVLWPQENMPFSESGMTPDVLINPHAFPSRMTIGMLVESMAGKNGAMHGVYQNATPFQFHEQNRVIDHMGEQLRACGYQYYGSEPLYNGMSGKVMHADIFMGLVYYQRLRHMVSDKSQVRSTGQVMALTRQPVKGRKKGGGIRLGEMERDALISHGVAFCLHDRLMNCSDSHLAFVCNGCGGLLAVYSQPVGTSSSTSLSRRNSRGSGVSGAAGSDRSVGGYRDRFQQTCGTCKTAAHVHPVYLPYVYRYLTNELAGMGIKLALRLSD